MAKVEPAREEGERGERGRSFKRLQLPGGGGGERDYKRRGLHTGGILSRALTWSLVFSRASISLLVLFWTFH